MQRSPHQTLSSWASTLRGPPGTPDPVPTISGCEKRWPEPVNAVRCDLALTIEVHIWHHVEKCFLTPSYTGTDVMVFDGVATSNV